MEVSIVDKGRWHLPPRVRELKVFLSGGSYFTAGARATVPQLHTVHSKTASFRLHQLFETLSGHNLGYV